MFSQNLAFFENIDGIEQHYTAFLYMGRWIREICRNIFVEHNFIIPLWNHGMGYGADIPTTLAAYIFDPFNYIAAIIPETWSEYVFDGIVAFKFYLCGLAYSIFAFYRRQKWPYVLIGAILYTFCGSMYIGFIQTYFINPMYLFPLLIVGFDRLWNKNKYGMYVILLTLCFLNHFYFAYMMSLFLLGYGILRFAADGFTMHQWKDATVKILKIGGFSVLAILGAAIILLPLAENLLQQGRMGIKYFVPLFYYDEYYEQLLLNFIRPTWMWARDCIIGLGVISLPCLFVFFRTAGNIRLKIEFIILTLCVCIPFAGHVLNGFSYAANRWIWAYSLLVSYMVSIALSVMDKKKLKFAVWCCLIYILFACLYTLDFENSFLMLAEAGITIFLLYYACGGTEQQALIIYTVTAIFSVLASAHSYFSTNADNWGKRQLPAGVAYQTVINDSGLPVLQQVMDKDVRRYNQIKLTERGNASWLYGLSGTNFYMSIYNDNVDKFHRSVALLTPPWVTQYLDLNRRTELAALLGVEYFITYNENQYLLPAEYDNLQTYAPYVIARPNFRTSLIYGFDKAISVDEFMRLSPFERQQALLQAVVLDNPQEPMSVKELQIQNEDRNFTLKSDDGMEVKPNRIYMHYANGYLNLLTEPLQKGEIYLYLNELDIRRIVSAYMLGFVGYSENIMQNNIVAMLKATTDKSHVYGNKHEWLINLGYTADKIDAIRIYFGRTGRYMLSDAKLYLRSEADIRENIFRLQPLGENISLENNKFVFDVNTDKEQYVFMSVPYSKGWKARVNNQYLPLIKADIAFMALLLPAGKHHVELSYETPYLRLGAFISLSIWLLLGIMLYRGRKKRLNVVS